MAYQALYRRYRPRRFGDVVGQDHITTTLTNQVRSGRIAHAYLFCGTRGTGKTTMAKIFARAINCPNAHDGEPCDACDCCTGNGGDGLDIIEIDAASNNGVDEIRDLREKVRFSPLSGRFKTYIIDEVHMLSAGAFNALLKTLEEPPAHAVFILATTEPQKLPATIHSRCQRYDFRRISVEDIIKRLKLVLSDVGAAFEEGGLRAIARAAEGGMRDALSLADQCIAFCGNEVSTQNVLSVLGGMDQEFLFSISDALIASDEANALRLLDKIFQHGRDLGVFCRDLTSHFRALLLIGTCPDARDLFDCADETYDQLRSQAQNCPTERALRAITLLAKAESDMKFLSVPRVLFEAALLRICRPQDETSMEALADRIHKLESALASGQRLSPSLSPSLSLSPSSQEPNPSPVSEPAQAVQQPEPKPTPTHIPAQKSSAALQGGDEQALSMLRDLLPLLPKQTQALANNPSMPWSARLDSGTLCVQLPQAFKAIADALNPKVEEFAQAFCGIHPGISLHFSTHAPVPQKNKPQDEVTRIKKVFGDDVKLEIIDEQDT